MDGVAVVGVVVVVDAVVGIALLVVTTTLGISLNI